MADSARDALQRQADGYARQGRLDAAIDAYEQVARAAPTDWSLIKQIADLQERAGRLEAAAARFLQCADHYFSEGFLARAAALYRKVLKLDGKSDHALSKLAEVSLGLELKMDARHTLAQLVLLRRERGDEEGAREASARLSALDTEGLTPRPPQGASESWRPAPMAPGPDPEADRAPCVESESEPESVPESVSGAPAAPGLEPPAAPPDIPPSASAAIPPAAVPVAVEPLAGVHEHSGPDRAFDWGALLGRHVEPPVPGGEPAPSPPDLTAWSAPVDVPAEDVPAERTPGPTPDDESAADAVSPVDLASHATNEARPAEGTLADLEVEEVDLTDLLDQLAMERRFQHPVPMPPVGNLSAPPAVSLHALASERPSLEDSSSELFAEESASSSWDRLAGVDAGGEADARVLASRHLAAGRVFAAAGLAAEAARAFERASHDVRTRFEAAEALAGLHRSRGQMVEAVRWYDEAARAPVADDAVRRPVLYDLAETLEAVGQPGRALAVLLDLLSEVEDYRDARARADRLLRVDAGG